MESKGKNSEKKDEATPSDKTTNIKSTDDSILSFQTPGIFGNPTPIYASLGNIYNGIKASSIYGLGTDVLGTRDLINSHITIAKSGIMGSQISPMMVTLESKDKYEEMVKSSEDAKEKIRNENKELKSQIEKLTKSLNELNDDKKVDKTKIKELNDIVIKYNSNENIRHLIDKVHPDAVKLLGESQKFRDAFQNKDTETDVLAIDIRRSTELMLKSKSPELFSIFITELCTQLSEIIKQNWGVFDKFTGDGILAFFPKFYSGDDSILKALKAAEECHNFFALHYNQSRTCFNTVLKEIGLGIGIDSGKAHIVSISGGLTVVGNPVVYACRMSGAKAGETLLNQTAYEKAYPRYSEFFKFVETEIDVKHEGKTIAYQAISNTNKAEITKPIFEEYK